MLQTSQEEARRRMAEILREQAERPSLRPTPPTADLHGECAVEIKRLRVALEKTAKRMRAIGFLDEAERIELLLKRYKDQT